MSVRLGASRGSHFAMTDAEHPRYLRYERSIAVVTGLNHQASNLACLLREAHACGRRALLPPLLLEPKYNFNIGREWRWESFFDLRGSRLVDAAGREHPLPLAAAPAPATAGLRALRVPPGAALPPDAGSYRLVVRRIENPQFAVDVPARALAALRLRLRAAPQVLALARPVVERLRSLDRGRFAAVHVRRRDRMREYPRLRRRSDRRYPGRMTEPARIRERLQAAGVADGAVLFVFSDERDPAFWNRLRQHYRVFRELDFPALAALLSPSGEPLPDNYLVYQTALEVMRSAELRIDTLPIRPPNAPPMHGSLVSEREWRRPSLIVHAVEQTVSLCRRLLR